MYSPSAWDFPLTVAIRSHSRTTHDDLLVYLGKDEGVEATFDQD